MPGGLTLGFAMHLLIHYLQSRSESEILLLSSRVIHWCCVAWRWWHVEER